jgi:UDP-N-acetylglucosamine--N-acetylmuramyl-(pentapeptide) pyrophosphoryl-undecaprenol N-acetylglucosamine transferase
MRILLTGGDTGGHFYPIISVAEEIENIVKEKKLLNAELLYMAPTPYDEAVLYEHGIKFKANSAGKLRRNLTLINLFRNFFDIFRMGWGCLISMIKVYRIYPDVVFGKGGYASFPVLLAARVLRIPVVIHESDTIPGRVNLWAGKFALRIAVSYPEAAKYFPDGKVAYTGNPVRKDIATPITEGAREFLKLESGVPVVFILGGSQGAQKINDCILGSLPELVEKYEIIHQTGKANFEEADATSKAVLYASEHKDRYKPFDYLNVLAMRMSAGIASVVITRAGSTLFEIASWGVPAIVIPISERVSRDQRSNAFAYARAGAGVVVEEDNLSSHVISAEIDRILEDKEAREKMSAAAKAFYKPEAARLIAEEIVKIALSHEIGK